MTKQTCLSLLAIAVVALAGCEGDGGLSTADVQAGAKERVRAQLSLTSESTLFTETFVGQPLDGDTTICGTVQGNTADGREIPPRRFIAAAEPARWVKFEPVAAPSVPAHMNVFAEWATVCAADAG